MKAKTKLKVGDNVTVIAGNHKDSKGKILAFNKKRDRAYVEGLNMQSKHVKQGQNPELHQGGIINVEGSIHVSNLMLLVSGKRTRIRYDFVEKTALDTKYSEKIRVAKATANKID